MKKKKFTETQIVTILKEGEAGIPITDLCRKYGMGQSTYFAWRSKYAGMSVTELKRLKQLEDENLRLKRMYASLSLDHELLREVLEKKLGVDVSEELLRKN
ncbi:transposase [Rickettsiella grylli]|uniref:Transposase subfamily n=1 Tax=Rickettsiella grylli TaxID=59196 RepID=A8PK11_9COXI|nr:transposase [Rickettsiella grylli]EDP46861.1 transposase subfamily [Rickettsiella grylli]EDP47008.1 transposase subfamily [Rickettsiella grylli]OJA00866.1 transposase [Rickettsiella grylli]